MTGGKRLLVVLQVTEMSSEKRISNIKCSRMQQKVAFPDLHHSLFKIPFRNGNLISTFATQCKATEPSVKISTLNEKGCTRGWPFKLHINVPLDLLVSSKIRILKCQGRFQSTSRPTGITFGSGYTRSGKFFQVPAYYTAPSHP